MTIRECTLEDIQFLAVLNKELIDDERSDNAMTVPELADRMRWFLETEYDAYFFVEEADVVGYALVRHTAQPLYLRQFMIRREYRRRHLRTQAFEALLKTLGTETIDIEVYSWNERGMRFWEKCGFAQRSVYMRREG